MFHAGDKKMSQSCLCLPKKSPDLYVTNNSFISEVVTLSLIKS